jgi:prepilin-type N-terminal cleavage/methylation domain-containing protein
MKYRGGFTITEVLIVVVVIAILAGIGVVAYNGIQQRAAAAEVVNDISKANDILKLSYLDNRSYPHNLSGTGFVSSDEVAITLYTDAPTIGTYIPVGTTGGLTEEQNAQLFLNTCNANIIAPNTSCTFQGNGNGAKVHVAGTNGSNTQWDLWIEEADVKLTCGVACTTAQDKIIYEFKEQRGRFPIKQKGNVSLPEPTVTPNGPASKYCLEARSGRFAEVVSSISSGEAKIKNQPCPSGQGLHYFTN